MSWQIRDLSQDICNGILTENRLSLVDSVGLDLSWPHGKYFVFRFYLVSINVFAKMFKPNSTKQRCNAYEMRYRNRLFIKSSKFTLKILIQWPLTDCWWWLIIGTTFSEYVELMLINTQLFKTVSLNANWSVMKLYLHILYELSAGNSNLSWCCRLIKLQSGSRKAKVGEKVYYYDL